MTKNTRNTPNLTDERTRRDPASDVRGDRGITEDLEREGTGLISDDDLDKIIAAEFEQTALPEPPPLPGWHLCWCSTTSQYDSLQKRQRLGYMPVRRDEMPGFDASNGANLANFEGFVTCNEMILCKIAEPRYQALMRYFHHKRPLQEEEAIIAKTDAAKQELEDRSGRKLVQSEGMDGMEDLERSVRVAQARGAPTFS